MSSGLVNSARHFEKQSKLIYLLREEKARRGLQDLYFFCKYILGYKDMELQPHREMCDFIQTDFPNKLDLEPRNSFKSSVITIGYAIQQIVLNPDTRILINSQDVSIAKKFLSEIKGHFEHNEEFINIYGDYVGPKWSDSEIIVKQRKKHRKEPTILTGGIETPRTGMHVDLLINDDLLDEHNTNTPDQIMKATDFWRHQQSLLETVSKEITVGTRWLVGDTYEEVMDIEKQRRKANLGRGLIVRKRGAFNKDGSLYFPTRLTEDYLAAKRIELGPVIFACQYLNNPVDEGATIFKRNWMKFYGNYPPKNLSVTVVLDPAVSEKDSACDSAFTVLGTDTDGYMYILDARFLKEEPDKVVNVMFDLQDLHKPEMQGIESVAFQKTFKFWAWERMRQTGNWINITELKTDTSVTKDMRIKALVPYFESGTILWPGEGYQDLTGDMLRLWDQVTQYPMSKLRDGVDSLAYHLQLYTPPAERRTKAEKPLGISVNSIMEERQKRLARKSSRGRPIIGSNSIPPRSYSSFERVG